MRTHFRFRKALAFLLAALMILGMAPAMALGAGPDGMDVVRRMLPEAASHLNDGGMIIVEVGDGAEAVEAAFPGLELTWLTTSGGDDQVFLVTKDALLNYFND